MQEEFGKQIGSVFTQWEGDIQKSKDAEEKLEVQRNKIVTRNDFEPLTRRKCLRTITRRKCLRTRPVQPLIQFKTLGSIIQTTLYRQILMFSQFSPSQSYLEPIIIRKCSK